MAARRPAAVLHLRIDGVLTVNTVLGGLGKGISGLAIDEFYVYVSFFVGGILRFTLSGVDSATSTTEKILRKSDDTTGNIEIDGTALRWSTEVPGHVSQCQAAACDASVSIVAADQDQAGGQRSTPAHVYWFTRGALQDGGTRVPKTASVRRKAK